MPLRALVSLPLLALLSGCGVPYVLQAGYHQAELMLSARPTEKVLAKRELSVGAEQRLRLVPHLKEFGKSLGLASTDNYSAVAIDWPRTIWTVTACDPVKFEPRTWWFPIVGRVPYLGFFSEAAALRQSERLDGYDIHRRTAGAYSTLGWFRDPILPNMLRWEEADLAETVFHELAHATLWIPGSVTFNESFASVVGEEAARKYLTATYGAASAELEAWEQGDRDWRRFETILWGLYKDLDALYADPDQSEADKLTAKGTLIASLPDRVRASDIEAVDRYLRVATRSSWNNARLMQFKAYNSNDDLFAAVLARADGDLPRFIDAIDAITHRKRDPFAALAAAVAVKEF